MTLTRLPAVRVVGDRFVDSDGREVMLRGVNLGGDCKVPYPHGGTHYPSDFADHREVSFIGRPFPLEQAHEHLQRLRHWGFNCVRLLTTWEAVEHAGPRRYDGAYLDYFTEVCRRAGDHGLYVFVDFHQDVWSRMSGGDGAPGWTFEAVGLDFTRFHDAGAAHVMQRLFDYSNPDPHQAAYPQMSWGSNYRLPANAIMWTLFWCGRTVTPQFAIDGVNVQDYLQRHYLGAMEQIAIRLRNMPHVLGFDTLNEPGVGWIGEALSYRHLRSTPQNPLRVRPGLALSALDALAIARGIPTTVPFLKRNAATGIAEEAGERLVNPNGVSIWLPHAQCPFEAAGAYRIAGGRAIAQREDIFSHAGDRALTVSEDGFGPLFHEVARVTRAHNPDWAVFAELDAFGAAAGRPFPRSLPQGSVNASHWYDSSTLYLKTFEPYDSYDFMTGVRATSPAQIHARYVEQIGKRARPARDFPGGAPTLIGEFGIPYDLDAGAAYWAWRDGDRGPAPWAKHVAALDLMYNALDELLLHSTQWNYTASNRNDLRIGDGWNQEDLSIFSADQRLDPADPDSGGRALEGFCRPFARRVQGRIRRMQFDRERRAFRLEYDADPTIGAPTEIYVPRLQFPGGIEPRVDGGAADLHHDGCAQLLSVQARSAARLTVVIAARR
jgi:hypothetical protein